MWAWRDGYYSNVFHLRAVKLQTFLTIRPCLPYTLILHYSDLNQNPTYILNLLNQKFNITSNNVLKSPSCYYIGKRCVSNNESILGNVQNYYKNKEYMKKFNQSHYNIIKHNLDYDLEEKFGYNYNEVKELWVK